jgi:molybdenum cofactor synthesis domain-containing protein
MRVSILTVSDSVASGDREDLSGRAITEWCAKRGDSVARREVVLDDTVAIASLLAAWCDAGDTELILTTGGTGLSPRDVTPEATRAVIERDAEGIAERIRVLSMQAFPRAALSRGVAGVRAATLVINLPGSPSGVRDGLAALDPVIDHACDVLSRRVTQHQGAGSPPVSPI